MHLLDRIWLWAEGQIIAEPEIDPATVEQQLVIDVSGHDRLGFHIGLTRTCHGWGGAFAVDSVIAR